MKGCDNFMLITETVNIKIINFNIDLYRSKGYNCKVGDLLEVKVEDVSIHSRGNVELLCDECNTNKKDVSICSLNTTYKDGKYICSECTKKLLNDRKCSICGSTHKVTNYLNQGVLLCQRHQRQLREKGNIKRTINDSNEVRLFNDYLEFDTYDIKANVNGTFTADLDMKDFIKNHKLYKHKDGYACYKFKDENGKLKNMRFHRYVMGVHLEKENQSIIDHIDRNKSNNRRKNLRIATPKDNIVNRGMLTTNTSGHKGISWDKRKDKWEAYIHKNNRKISLGMYSDFDKAVQVREVAEIIYFGKNNPNYKRLIKTYINNKEIQNYLLNNKIEGEE